jgi:hypothetical protein
MKDANLFRAVAPRVNLLDSPDAMGKDADLIARAEQIARETEPPASMGPLRSELVGGVAESAGL